MPASTFLTVLLMSRRWWQLWRYNVVIAGLTRHQDGGAAFGSLNCPTFPSFPWLSWLSLTFPNCLLLFFTLPFFFSSILFPLFALHVEIAHRVLCLLGSTDITCTTTSFLKIWQQQASCRRLKCWTASMIIGSHMSFGRMLSFFFFFRSLYFFVVPGCLVRTRLAPWQQG